MLERLFPKQADNASYQGWRAAIWLAVPLVLVRALMNGESIVMAHNTAINADGIPLGTYPPDAAAMATLLFALLGLWGVLNAALGAIVLWRYRALLPLYFLLLLTQSFGNKVLHAVYPVASGGAKTIGAGIPVGQFVSTTILVLMILTFVLSLLPRARTA